MERLFAFVAGALLGGAAMGLSRGRPGARKLRVSGKETLVSAAPAADHSTAHLLARIQSLVAEIRSLSRHAEAGKGGPAAGAAPGPWAVPVLFPGQGWILHGMVWCCGAAAVGMGFRKGGGSGTVLAAGGGLLLLAEAARLALMASPWRNGEVTAAAAEAAGRPGEHAGKAAG